MELRELMSWATNIVRLPLKADVHDDLAAQIRDFPPEFLLFVPHVRYLSLEAAGEESREFTLREEDGEFRLDTGKGTSHWRRFTHSHQLSAEARADSRSLDDASDVSITWVAPLDRLNELGYFGPSFQRIRQARWRAFSTRLGRPARIGRTFCPAHTTTN